MEPGIALALAPPLVGAAIGWLTNWVAVRMLFWPRRPVRLLGVTLQGVFPSRQPQLARELGGMVERELLSAADVGRAANDPAFLARLGQQLAECLESTLREKLSGAPMASRLLGGSAASRLTSALADQLEKRVLPRVVAAAARELEGSLHVAELVRQRVEAASVEQVEAMLLGMMRRELRFVELVGGLLGFVIGLAQSALILLR